MNDETRIAIVGMGGVFPGATDLAAFERMLRTNSEVSREVPPGRWAVPPEGVLDPRPGQIDRVYSLRGCFLHEGADEPAPDRVAAVATRAAQMAWTGAGLDDVAPDRVSVILGAIALPTAGFSQAAAWSWRRHLHERFGLSEPIRPSAAWGPVVGGPAQVVAQTLGISGRAFTLDAACASSLYALKLGMDELRTGRADAVLVGGVSCPDLLYTQMGFAQLRALSKRGRAAPFDTQADGLLVGEGAGVLVLKRLEDARRFRGVIHAIVAGVGLSNDVEGKLLAPSSEGQLRAMRQAYDHAGWAPTTVDYVECHATGTALGDATEFASLRALWAEATWRPGQTVLGSVKANIGHLLTAANAASIIKILLGFQHGRLYPTPNFQSPAPGIDLLNSPFRVLQATEPWLRRGDRPRRAAVSGFGFGGINAHMLLEEPPLEPTAAAVHSLPPARPKPAIAVVAIAARCGNLNSTAATLAQAWSASPPSATAATMPEQTLQTGNFHIPPVELAAMLPQQVLALRLAHEAMHGLRPHLRTGVFLGVDLDFATTNYHLRWTADEWARPLNPARQVDVAAWLSALVEERLPPLTADRVMGNLASIAASRIAREFGLGGPCFTVSSGASSGITACRLAIDALRAGELECALVGAVDFATEPRRLDQRADHDRRLPVDAGVVLILKTRDRAEAEGDPILALLDQEAAIPAERPPVGYAVDAGAATDMLQLAASVAAVSECVHPATGRYWWRTSEASPRRIAVPDAIKLTECLGVQEPATPQKRLPLVHRPLRAEVFPLAAMSKSELGARLQRLAVALTADPEDWRKLARQCRAETTSDAVRLAIVAATADEARDLVLSAQALVTEPRRGLPGEARERLFLNSIHQPPPPLAFVFPGSGNHTATMGQDLAAQFPHVVNRVDAESAHPCENWGLMAQPDGSSSATMVDALVGQVMFSVLTMRILEGFGIYPDAALGFSLGESAALVALGAWRDRDELFRRLKASTLFQTDLTGVCHAARAYWQWPPDRPFAWQVWLVRASAETVMQTLDPTQPTRLVAVLSPRECLVGGEAAALAQWHVGRGWPVVPLDGVAAVHGPMAESLAEAYQALHTLPTQPIGNVRLYSGAWGRAYDPDQESAAASITAGAMHPLDFRRTIEAAYADGVRVFVEIGPGSSCTRAVRDTLEGRPHEAFSLHSAEEVTSLATGLARLFILGYPVVWAALGPSSVDARGTPSTPGLVRLPTRGPFLPFPPVPGPNASPALEGAMTTKRLTRLEPLHVLQGMVRDKGQAHAAFLRFARRATTLLAAAPAAAFPAASVPETEVDATAPASAEVFLTRDQCLTFATGRIGDVLGPDFAAVDSYPTRVRLPDEPLMLVDRILAVVGEPGSLGSGQVVTEHDVLPGAWYLDGGRIPTCIAVEAGQADLFLSAYLGIDRVTQGRAVYRLLDAVVTFHDGLPQAGTAIHYDIRIERFFRQEATHLFRFSFDATVDGRPLLTMREGCAGFFTPEELASGRGVVRTELQRRPQPGRRDPRLPLTPTGQERYDWWQLLCLRQGDLAGCFGPDFAGLPLHDPLRLPGGRMKLFDRVVALDANGGRFGIGQIRTELDIHPDDWFLTCHFVDDQVMPGTLMYECCLHSLRFMLYRLGWLAEADDVVCEPVPGVASRLKCRGQVTAATRVAAFEIDIKTLGYGPDAYALADALMYADGKPIVEITDMSLRLTGLTAERVAALWSQREAPARAAPPTTGFGPERIRAFAVGRPSEAFGAPYRPFDTERRIARLPGPPYQFVDRIVEIAAKPWRLQAGGTVTAEYDVPPRAWYFSASRQPRMPFAVLLEVALQPCGWLAAYLGSALSSHEDLAFRNLGGMAVQYRHVASDAGTLTTRVKITQVAQSAGMIIQHFDFAVTAGAEPVYTGNTYFGFFTQAALRDQIGIKAVSPFVDPSAEAVATRFPDGAPWPDARWRMLDTLEMLSVAGGPYGMGWAQGSMDVDPTAWFFAAHFHQDPVCPGSLGLESLVELLKMMALIRWQATAAATFESPCPGREHRWTYRGQVIPAHQRVTVQAWPKGIDDQRREIVADGLLAVDGRVIYRMQDFSLRLIHP